MSQHDMIYLRDGGTPFKVYDPNDDRRTPAPTNRQLEPPSPELIAGTMIELEPVRWLWPQWLAKGKLHLVAGAPGTGKTTIALAATITAVRTVNWPSWISLSSRSPQADDEPEILTSSRR